MGLSTSIYPPWLRRSCRMPVRRSSASTAAQRRPHGTRGPGNAPNAHHSGSVRAQAGASQPGSAGSARPRRSGPLAGSRSQNPSPTSCANTGRPTCGCALVQLSYQQIVVPCKSSVRSTISVLFLAKLFQLICGSWVQVEPRLNFHILEVSSPCSLWLCCGQLPSNMFFGTTFILQQLF